MADLLYEIGAEEIPAGYIEPALEQLARALARELELARLSAWRRPHRGTPRRLSSPSPPSPSGRRTPKMEALRARP